MRFLLLIQEPVDQRAGRSREEARAVRERMLSFGESLATRGQLVASESLLLDGASRVAVRDGAARTIDGPFAEAKEIVGGFFLVDCAGPDEARAIAAECPAAGWACVEVRQLGPCDEPPASR